MYTIAPIHYLCVFGMTEDWRLERRLRRAEKKIATGFESEIVGREGLAKIIPNPHFRLIFTSVFLGSSPPSYSFINATVRILVTRSHCDDELHRNQSDMRRSTFQIGAALVESGKIAWICDEILVLINIDKSFLCSFTGTSLNGENWFEHVFVLLSHLAAKRLVAKM